MDRNVYDLCCQTFQVPSSLTAGVEEPFFGAMTGLIGFRGLTITARKLWDAACQKAAQDATSLGFPTRSATAWMALFQARQDAFEFAVDDDSVLGSDVGIYPWALTPQEFADCRALLDKGQVPHTITSEPPDFMIALKGWKSYSGATVVFLKTIARKLPKLEKLAKFIVDSNIYVDSIIILGPPIEEKVELALAKSTVYFSNKRFEIDRKRRLTMGQAISVAKSQQ